MPGPMFDTPPALASLKGFSDRLVSLDVLHIFHLGVLRDLVGTGFKLLGRKRGEYYNGRRIPVRLHQLTQDLKAFCRTNNFAMLSAKNSHEHVAVAIGLLPGVEVQRCRCFGVLEVPGVQIAATIAQAISSIAGMCMVCTAVHWVFIFCIHFSVGGGAGNCAGDRLPVLAHLSFTLCVQLGGPRAPI